MLEILALISSHKKDRKAKTIPAPKNPNKARNIFKGIGAKSGSNANGQGWEYV